MATPAKLRPADSDQALVDTADFIRLDAARRLDPERQGQMGQFMTPAPVAKLMASMFTRRGKTLRLLDPGAGAGSLTAAWVAAMCDREHGPEEIVVVAYEIDGLLAGHLAETLDACRGHCERAGVSFASHVYQEDFVAAAVGALNGGLFATPMEPFDCTILNPPYRKINTDSRTRRLLEGLGAETTNLYTAFMSLASRLLRPGGELVAITPRSFCNGPYFRGFRQAFLREMALRRIHTFETRNRAFSDDDVLQENLIVHALRRPAKQGSVTVSASLSPADECPSFHRVPFEHVVKADDQDVFIHVPTDALSEALTEWMESFKGGLAELGLEVSTGRVVDFRASKHLRQDAGEGTVPLVYPGHLQAGFVSWPRRPWKKPNALALGPDTDALLVPAGFYVLVKRFSSKEERRRIVAAVYDPGRMPASDVAFENHLNYFHAHGRPLAAPVAKGLALFLNSSLVDSYFREWSGHTQVNASDLRRLPYPSLRQLERLGASLDGTLPNQDEIDRLVDEHLLMSSLKKSPHPIRARKRVKDAVGILKALGLPREQQNDRSALTLLALLDLKPSTPWAKAKSPLRGITEMMGFFSKHYGKNYKPNTRETVRRMTVHQFVQAGLAVPNPDKPRPTNSPQAVYQIEASALELLRTFGTDEWDERLRSYLASTETLTRRYAREREMERIPLTLAPGKQISLSPGGQNVLVKEVMEQFCPRFTPGAKPIYVGDTSEKWAFFDEAALRALGVSIEAHGKMPDIVVHHENKGWLVLIEAVTSHGPVNPKRHEELKELFADSEVGLVFVTAFLTRRELTKYLGEIAWETEVWVAEAPTHLIHFNGERFLGPF